MLGTRVRSLYDTGITVGDSASFLTLASAPAADGTRLCVTGRLIADNENAQLAAALIEQRTDPLLPAARYQAQGQAMPDVSTQMSQEMEWYLNAGVDVAAFDDGAGTDANGTAAGGPGVDTQALNESIEQLQDQTNQLTANVDTLLAGLTDKAGEEGAAESDIHQGAEGKLPEQQISVRS